MTAQQYQQGILRFTPPGEFSQGFDFTPLWLQIDNPSSYYISFPQAPSLGTIPPYYTGVIVAWNQSNLTVNVLASPGASGSPSLPSSNAEVTILATNNPSLGVSPGTPLPVFQQGKVVWAPVIPSSTSIQDSFTYTPAPNATGIAFIASLNAVNVLTEVAVNGATSVYYYIQESLPFPLQNPAWYASPIIGGFEPLTLYYSNNTTAEGTQIGWFVELYGNMLTMPSAPLSQPTIVQGGVPQNTLPWESTAGYEYGDVVYITTGTAPGFYFCVVGNSGNAPPNTTYWFPMTLALIN